jgi:hypothetical protein
MSVKRLVPLHAVVLDADPIGTRMGEIYFNSTESELRFYNGTEWLPIGSGGMVTGLLDHIHTYDGAVFSVESIEVPASGTIDGGSA